jgi:large subunit ribosomal protein L32
MKQLLKCESCGAFHLAHHVCPNCGSYRGETVVEIEDSK